MGARKTVILKNYYFRHLSDRFGNNNEKNDVESHDRHRSFLTTEYKNYGGIHHETTCYLANLTLIPLV